MSGPEVDIAPLIARIRAVYAGWRRETPVAQRRADWDALFGAAGPAHGVQDTLGGVPCVWVRAPGVSPDHVIVYFHGGGFQLGSPRSHQEMMGLLSEASGASVLAVDYRLLPEYTYPAPLDDAMAVLAALRERGLAPCRMALAGDSAGGNIALGAALRLQAGGHAQPAAVYGLSAWTDLSLGGASYDTQAGCDPLHQPAMLRAIAQAYLGAQVDPREPEVSPCLASPAQLGALAPVLLQVGEREVLVSDALDLAERVRAAGGQAQAEVWPGMFHVFQQFPAALPQARQALASGGAFLAEHLGLGQRDSREQTP